MGGCTFLYNELVQFLLVFCAEVLERGGCFRGDVQVVHIAGDGVEGDVLGDSSGASSHRSLSSRTRNAFRLTTPLGRDVLINLSIMHWLYTNNQSEISRLI